MLPSWMIEEIERERAEREERERVRRERPALVVDLPREGEEQPSPRPVPEDAPRSNVLVIEI